MCRHRPLLTFITIPVPIRRVLGISRVYRSTSGRKRMRGFFLRGRHSSRAIILILIWYGDQHHGCGRARNVVCRGHDLVPVIRRLLHLSEIICGHDGLIHDVTSLIGTDLWHRDHHHRWRRVRILHYGLSILHYRLSILHYRLSLRENVHRLRLLSWDRRYGRQRGDPILVREVNVRLIRLWLSLGTTSSARLGSLLPFRVVVAWA